MLAINVDASGVCISWALPLSDDHPLKLTKELVERRFQKLPRGGDGMCLSRTYLK